MESADKEFIDAMKKVPVFDRLSVPQIRKILSVCRSSVFPKDETICEIGSSNDEMHILLDGKLAVTQGDGKVIIVLDPIVSLGEFGLEVEADRRVRIVAAQESSVLVLKHRDLKALFKSDPHLAVRVYKNIIAIMSSRFVNENIRLSDMEEMKLKIKRLEIQQRVSLEFLAENGVPIAEAAPQVAARLRERLPTILIVDDEESIRITIGKALRDYNVIEAANGEEGMQKIQEHDVDLVISDLYMPDFDGFQLLEALRNEGSVIPVVGISGFVDADRAKSLGFDAFLIKPFVFADLLSTISKLRKAADEKGAALPETSKN